MISTETGYEEWLEQRRVAFEARKETYTKEPTESGAKKQYCVFCRPPDRDWEIISYLPQSILFALNL